MVLPKTPARAWRAGLRFRFALISCLLVWSGLMALLFAMGDERMPPADAFASLLVLLSGVCIVHAMWTLIGYGYTISMLIDLAGAERPLGADEWALRYGGGAGVRGFLEDRLQLLLSLRLVTQDEDAIRIAGPKAIAFARFLRSAKGALIGV